MKRHRSHAALGRRAPWALVTVSAFFCTMLGTTPALVAAQVSRTALAAPTAQVSGSATICAGASTSIQAALTGTPPWSLTWSDGFQQSVVDSGPAIRSVSPVVTTTYSVTTVSSTDGSAPGTGSAVITVNPRPTAIASGTAAICAGSSTPLTGSGGTSCSWAPGTGLSSATSCSPAASPSTTTAYTLTVTDGNGCVSINAPTVTVTVNATPAPSITSPSSVSPGQTGVTASVLSNAGSSYAWTISNGTITSASSGASITFTAGPSGTVVLMVTETNASGCTSAQASKGIAISGGLPSATVTGSGTICAGAALGIQAFLTGAPPWSLTWSDGFVMSAIAASPATRSVSPTTTTTYTVTSVSNAAGSSPGTGSAVVTVTSAPIAPVITAPSSAFPSQAGLIARVPQNSGSTYSWTIINGNGSITDGATTNVVTFTAGVSGSVDLSVIERSASGCDSIAARASVTISGGASISLSPSSLPTIVGNSVSLTATISPVQSSATTISLLSSAASIASVPASAVVSPGRSSVSFTVTPVAPGVATIKATLPPSLGAGSASASVTVFASCFASIAPVLSSTSRSFVAGQSIAIDWKIPSDLASGTYLVETSKDAFASIDSTITVGSPNIIVPTNVSAIDSTLSIRVRAIQGCGTPSANSNVLSFASARTPATFVVTRAAAPLITSGGGSAPSTSIELKNVGGVSERVTFLALGDFVFLDKAVADVPAGAVVSVKLTATQSAIFSDGVYAGLLSAKWESGELQTPVSLSVIPSLVPTGARVRTSTNAVTFTALPGLSPASQTIELLVDPIGTNRVFLTSAIGPGGSWLTISNALGNPVPASGRVSLTLSADRSRRSAQDGIAPFRTLLRITPVGGDLIADSAIIEVLDVEPVPVLPGTDRDPAAPRNGLLLSPPPGGRSFIVPTTVRATGLGGQQVFTSDGWLRNPAATPVSADLYLTPDGRDGLTDPSVKKAGLTLPAGSTYRLSDLVSNLFQTTNISGQLEVRSSSTSTLSLRSTVESITAGDPTSRYGAEIPTVSFGSGIALNRGELVVPGIDDDATNRANLILSETTGFPASVMVRVTDANGVKLGEIARDVPPYGKIQIDRVVKAIAPGATLSGGWASVRVTSGQGKVAVVATVIDNHSGSFSAILGRGALNLDGSSGPVTEPDTAVTRLIIPSLARTIGGFSTQFSTGLSIANPTITSANLTLTYEYIDQEDGDSVRSSRKSIIIPARGALAKSIGSDIIANLFGVAHRSYGSILMEGDVTKIVAVGGVSAQVDPDDASKGLKTAQVDALYLGSSDVMGINEQERRFAGIEKSVQRRTNVILREVMGQTCRVLVRLYSAAGAKLGDRAFDLEPNEYRQITDVFGNAGVNLGEGPFQNVEVTAQVVSGSGRVVAIATVNDNISRNPEIFILASPGPPDPGPSTGF